MSARHDHPGTAGEEVGCRRAIAGNLAPRHRVATDEPQPSGVGPSADRLLRARNVGHDGVCAEGFGQRTAAELVDQGQACQWRGGEDDEIRAAHRLGRRSARLVDDRLGFRELRTAAGGTPCRDRPGTAVVAQGTCD
jgi:hypothetical protein